MGKGRRYAVLLGLVPVLGMGQSGSALDAYMRELAIEGKVQVENGRVADPGLDANTRFDLNVQARWNYELSVVQRKGELELQVKPEFVQLDVGVRHRLRLPSENPDSPRFRTLLLHEYDHVAISVDPRPRILLRQLIRNIGTIRKAWTGPVPPPDANVHALISAEIESRKEAVVKLVEFAYRKLDRTSDHGRQAILNRGIFAGWLFGREHLGEAGFSFAKEAVPTLALAEYLTAKRWFRI